jgi:hypothetical protein
MFTAGLGAAKSVHGTRCAGPAIEDANKPGWLNSKQFCVCLGFVKALGVGIVAACVKLVCVLLAQSYVHWSTSKFGRRDVMSNGMSPRVKHRVVVRPIPQIWEFK